MKKFFGFFARHKVVAIIAILLISGGVYYKVKSAGSAGETRYVLAAAAKGTLITSVSGSGQVSASNQIDVKSKASGDITYVFSPEGQPVKAGTVLAKIDATDASRAVRDAKTALETAQLDLEQTVAPADALSLLQAQNALAQLKDSRQSASDALQKSVNDGFTAVTNAFFSLPGIIADSQNLLYANDIAGSQYNVDAYGDMVKNYDNDKVSQYQSIAIDSYNAARAAYDQNFSDYKSLTRYADNASIQAMVGETYDTATKMAEAIKDANDLVSYVNDTLTKAGKNAPRAAATHLATIQADTSTLNGILSNLLSIKTTISNSQQNIIQADRSTAEKELALQKLQAGADELTIRSKRLVVQQKQDALTTAEQNLADCAVRAPFDGILAKMDVKKGDTAANGTTIATIITPQQMATVSLNEVDVSKVKVGQKVNLTFDAVPDLAITGQVIEVDSLGAVSQGVVTYSVKIVFDTQDPRIKSGMSVSAAIITNVKQDVLLVPNSAVKTNSGSHYVEMLQNPPAAGTAGGSGVTSVTPPVRQAVEIGDANDTSTEITGGLSDGDQVITRTITATAATASSGQSILPTGGRSGAAGGGAGAVRMYRGD